MAARYFNHHDPANATTNNKAKPMWRRLLEGRDLAEPLIRLRVGTGNTKVVVEQWLACGHLASMPPIADVRICDLWSTHGGGIEGR